MSTETQAIAPPGKLLLKPDEAARALSISRRTLGSLTQRGEITAIRIGRSIRYDPADLREWVELQKPDVIRYRA